MILPWIDPENMEWEKILPLDYKIKVKKGEDLVKTEKANNMYYLKKGLIKVSLMNFNGTEKVFWHVPAGNIFGEVLYFLDIPPYASMIAELDSEIYVFSKEIIEKNFLSNINITKYFLHSMATKIRLLITELEDSSYHPINRISKLLYLMANQ